MKSFIVLAEIMNMQYYLGIDCVHTYGFDEVVAETQTNGNLTGKIQNSEDEIIVLGHARCLLPLHG